MKAAVIFWSGTGHTEAMAGAVLEGLKAGGAEAELFQVSNIAADTAAGYDALALGCPAMGSEELESDEFEPFFAALEPSLKGKKIALFGSYSWADGQWMEDWRGRAEADGAILVADGLAVRDEPDDAALEQCRTLGTTLANA
jgi:flavodoxin short chain